MEEDHLPMAPLLDGDDGDAGGKKESPSTPNVVETTAADADDSDDDDIFQEDAGDETGGSAIEILPDYEDEDMDQPQQTVSVDDDADAGSIGEEQAKTTRKAANTTDDTAKAYDSPPASPTKKDNEKLHGSPHVAFAEETESSPTRSSKNTSPKSKQRSFMNRFANSLAMSPKRQTVSVEAANDGGPTEEDGKDEENTDEKEGKEEKSTNASSKKQNRFGMPTPSEVIKSPIPTFRTIKARAAAVMMPNKSIGELPDDTLAGEEEFGSSDDDYSDDDILSIGDDASFLFEDDFVDHEVDFTKLSYVPNSFLDLPPDSYDYLDIDIVKTIGEQDISTFAWEHHLLVKGVAQLLAERDHIGVEDDVHATSNILKMGVLKKRRGVSWFVKFVEVRKGNLSFFDDESSGNKKKDKDNSELLNDDSARRRTVHLRKRTCTCQAVSSKDVGNLGLGGAASGYVFELKVEGGPRRLWMAKSEEERQAWIRAITQAMIGDEDDSLDDPLDLIPYQNAIDSYESVQSSLKQVKNRQEFLVAVDSLLYRQRSSSALRLPIKWVREHFEEEHGGHEDEDALKPLAAKRQVRGTIHDFWDKLTKTAVVINGYLVTANEPYSAERVIGALTRCIMEFDRVEHSNDESSSPGPLQASMLKDAKKSDDERMSELEAISYVRKIIGSILRSMSRGDAFSAVEELVCNDLVSCVEVKNNNSEEPIHIDVSFAGDDFSEEPSSNHMLGWITTRTKKNRRWKERYFVVSEGVLSYFERAEPRPSGLRGQMVLSDAKLKVGDGANNMLIGLQAKDSGREVKLQFDNRGDFVRWKTVLERATASEQKPGEEGDQYPDTTSRGPGKIGKAGKRAMKAMKKGAKMKKFMNRMGYSSPGSNGDTTPSRHRPTNDMVLSSTRGIPSDQKCEKREPRVQVVIEQNSVFKVVARSGNDAQDALL